MRRTSVRIACNTACPYQPMWRSSPAFLFLGAGVLLPWNAFISTTYDSMSASHVDRAITLVYLPVTLSNTLLFTLACGESTLARPRIVAGFTVYVACTLVAPLLGNLWGLLTLVAATGVADAASQGALFGLAGERDASSINSFNPQGSSKMHTQSLVTGTSLSGIVTSVLNILTRSLIRDDETRAVCYFWTVSAFCGMCAVVYLAQIPVDDGRPLTRPPPLSSSSPIGSSLPPTARMEPLELEHPSRSKEQLIEVLKKAWVPLVALTLVYWVTIAIFPGVLQENVHDAADGGWVAPVATFVFNVCDGVGKIFPPALIASDTALLAIAGSRVLFVPVCLASVHAHPALICFLVGALGLTNGLLTVWTLTKVQLAVDENEEYLAGNVALVALMSGLTLGAASSWLLR